MNYKEHDNEKEFEITTKKLKKEEQQQVSIMQSIMKRLGIEINTNNKKQDH